MARHQRRPVKTARNVPPPARPGAAQSPDALRQQLLARANGKIAGHQAGQLVIDTERGPERWSLALQPLQFDGRALTLLVLLPLESALEAERLEAWRQLVQVLTHEIMNSLTPIASLAQAAGELDDQPERQLALGHHRSPVRPGCAAL